MGNTSVVIPRPTGRPFLDAQGHGASGRPLAFAHRGGATHPDLHGLENSLEAFAHAVDLGYRYLETDVHVTSDGVLVAFHDDRLDRTTDATGALADLTWAEVSRARIGGRVPIPRFADLVEAFPDARFNVDVKAPGAVRVLADFIAEHDLADRVLVGSFDPRRLADFRRAAGPTVPTSASAPEVVAWVLLPGCLARLLTRGHVAALQVPVRHGRIPVTTPRLVRKAHRQGVAVHVWTVDEPAQMETLLRMGVDGLMTDRTDVLKDVLNSRGLWKDNR